MRRLSPLLFLAACTGDPPVPDTGLDTGPRGYAIHGTVVGLVGGQLTLTNGVGDSLVIREDGPFSFPATILDDTPYAVTVEAQPEDPVQECTVLDGGGAIAGADVQGVDVRCLHVAPSHPGVGDDWNTWIDPDGAPCDPDAQECVHVGERRVVRVPGAASCDGVSATDSLGVFDWSCEEGDEVVVRSALRPGRGLSALVDATEPAWRPLSVTVTAGGAALPTPETVWWGNDVTHEVEGLGYAGTIVALPSDPGEELVLSDDRVALVVQAGTAVGGGGGGGPVVSAAGMHFPWLEGTFRAGGVHEGVDLSDTAYATLRGVHVTGATGTSSGDGGIDLDGAHHARLVDVISRGNESTGIALDDAHHNHLERVVASGNGRDGVRLDTSDHNVLVDLRCDDNGDEGLELRESHDARVRGLRAGGNEGNGLQIREGGGHRVSDVIVAAGLDEGVQLVETRGNVLVDVTTSGHLDNRGIEIEDASNNVLVGLHQI